MAQTVGPEINSKHADDDYAKVAGDILNHPKYAVRNVFICWHHGRFRELAEALGVSNPVSYWPVSVFDRVWKIDYPTGQPVFSNLP